MSKGKYRNDAMDIYQEMYGVRPTEVAGQFNMRAMYYRQRIIRRLLTVFRFNNIPDSWDEEWLKLMLITRGYVCVGNTSQFGVIPMHCTYSGINVYNRPTKCLVDNHILHGLKFTIGKDCILMKIKFDYMGLNDMLNIYSQKLASIDASIDVNLINTRAAWIFDCDGKAQEATAKAIYDDITSGRPAVFARVNTGGLNTDGKVGITMLNVKNTYVSDLLQDEKRSVWYELLTDLGINNSNIDKKERVNTLEVVANTDELRNSIEDIKSNLELSCKEINDMFGLGISVEFPYYQDEIVNEEMAEENKKEGDANEGT